MAWLHLKSLAHLVPIGKRNKSKRNWAASYNLSKPLGINMNMQTLQAFLGWNIVIHAALILILFLLFVFGKRWVLQIHKNFFPLSTDQFQAAYFYFLAGYKILLMVFILVPYLVIRFLL